MVSRQRSTLPVVVVVSISPGTLQPECCATDQEEVLVDVDVQAILLRRELDETDKDKAIFAHYGTLRHGSRS